MKLRKLHKLLLLVVAIVLLAVTVTAILYYANPVPPGELIEKNRKIISLAVKEGAKFHAKEELTKAEKLRERMLQEWRKQIETPVLKRDYKQVEELAELSTIQAEETIRLTISRKKQLNLELTKLIDQTEKGLNIFKNQYYQLPTSNGIKEKYLQASLLFHEALSASERNDKIQALIKVRNSSAILKEIQDKTASFVEDYFKMYPQWEKWVTELIKWSRQNKEYAIVVDKFAHTCTLYKSGNIIKDFTMEMGPNWIGDKIQKGDRATPEGKYHITKKLERPKTIYYKALLINYPNDEDKKRFSMDIKNGALPRGTQIGNLIEIHGEGGKGIHWTDGCVALLNKDMDILYQYVRVGTPVTIVGSTKPLSQIFE